MSYLRPERLEDALAALEGGDRRVVAGCTDVFPATERRALGGAVLDVTGIPGLRGIARTEEGWTIGATTTWSDVMRADLPPAFRALQLAAAEVGARQIQNRGTVGGNLCNASPAADGVPPLLVLDAEVELSSVHGLRRMALSEFIAGPRRTLLEPGELLTAVHIPGAAARGASGFLKLGARASLVISIAMCAVRIEVEGGRIVHAALSVGSCGPVATRLDEAEAAITGHPPDPGRITDAAVAGALAPIDDVRADAAYRARAAADLLRRTLAALARAEAA